MAKINPNNLWIGDRLLLLKSNRIGFFQGMKNGKIRVRIENAIILTSVENIALAPESKSNPALEIINDEINNSPETSKNIHFEKQSFIASIDLHIEKLQASKRHDPPVAIVEFQLRKLREFMDNAVRLRANKVEVIHGKGTGALRMEAENLVRSYNEFVSIYPINDGGGMIVYLK